MRIAYFGYRGWGFSLLDKLLEDEHLHSQFVLLGTVVYKEENIDYSRYRGLNLQFFDPKDKQALASLILNNNINLALFYGWSWIVPESLTDSIDCICLHPSLLPKYRGGTPFQHQIINNEQEGGLTLFKMNKEIDAGDIIKQKEFPLDGRLKDVLNRVVLYGAEATRELIDDYNKGVVVYKPQENLDEYPPYPRREPKESQIPFEKLSELSSVYFYNFVRALDDPFPNCYIELPNGKVLFIKEVIIEPIVPDGAYLVNNGGSLTRELIYIKLKDGFARVVRYTISN